MKGLRRSRKRGQALVESALILPVLVLLMLGTFDGSLMGSNQLGAYAAVRHGARLAAELGGYGTPGVLSPKCYGTILGGTAPADSTVDNPILQDILTAAFERKDTTLGNKHLSGLDYVDITQIVIYRPSAASGKYNDPSGSPPDHANVYNITSQVVAGKTQAKVTQAVNNPAYPLKERCQGPLGSEAEIGIQMTYHYHPVNHLTDALLADIPFTDYAVEKESLCDTNCNP